MAGWGCLWWGWRHRHVCPSIHHPSGYCVYPRLVPSRSHVNAWLIWDCAFDPMRNRPCQYPLAVCLLDCQRSTTVSATRVLSPISIPSTNEAGLDGFHVPRPPKHLLTICIVQYGHIHFIQHGRPFSIMFQESHSSHKALHPCKIFINVWKTDWNDVGMEGDRGVQFQDGNVILVRARVEVWMPHNAADPFGYGVGAWIVRVCDSKDNREGSGLLGLTMCSSQNVTRSDEHSTTLYF